MVAWAAAQKNPLALGWATALAGAIDAFSDTAMLPLAEEKVALTLAGYRAGANELASVIAARRERVEARLKHIDFAQARAQSSARLHFAYEEVSQ